MNNLVYSVLSFVLVFMSSAGYIPRKYQLPLLLRATIGTVLVCLFVSPILYWQVRIVKYLFVSFVLFGYFLMFRELKIHFKGLKFLGLRVFLKDKLPPIILFMLFAVLISFLFLDFYPLYYIYIEHDLLYWSWPAEISRSNYSGGIRSEIAWPMQFSSYHVLPGTLLAYLNIFSPVQTMVGILFQKYLILIFVPAAMLTHLSVNGLRFLLKHLIAFALPLIIFRDEISYSLSISNYLVIYLILICFWVMFQLKDAVKLPSLTILFFLLIFSKMIVFPIALTIFIVYFLKTRNFYSRNEFGISIYLFISNLFVWIFATRPLESSSINIMNIFTFDFLGSMYKLGDWVIDPSFVSLSTITRHYLTFFIILLVVFKIFIIFYFCINRLMHSIRSNNQQFQFGDNPYTFYATWYGFMISSLFLLVFFRTSDTSEIKHAAQLLFICSAITLFFIGRLLVQLLFTKVRYAVMLVILIALASVSPYKILIDHSFFSPKHETSVRSISIKSLELGTFEILNEDETHVQKQIKASILGQRLPCTNSNIDKVKSPIYLFLYLPENEVCEILPPKGAS